MGGFGEVVVLFTLLVSIAGVIAFMMRPRLAKPKSVDDSESGGLFGFAMAPLHAVNKFLFGGAGTQPRPNA